MHYAATLLHPPFALAGVILIAKDSAFPKSWSVDPAAMSLLRTTVPRMSINLQISGSFHTAKPTSTRSYVRTVHVDFKLASGTGVRNGFSTTNLNGLPDVSVGFYDNAKAEFGDKWDEVRVAVITLPNGIKISWDGIKQVEISMPDSFKGSLCGICGEIGSSDMVIGGHDMTHQDDNVGCASKAATMTVGSITTDEQEYANSYYIAGDEDLNEECREECG
ncbi:hypothetical protein CAPTEDRAFT_211140 [Capitella teleta]|uniref:VWFD domain-containing protein n=1 Tax=Capitella teleta TaxID=283909 RepID=R7TU18_CAPTE|nr:hypothetical protein CAPTEDRAFT_211140 [Capitella teleta]|eukprot:ELT94515.1 hypothetical protein CAPTEDRAFT_211140 [Capitella teleta]